MWDLRHPLRARSPVLSRCLSRVSFSPRPDFQSIGQSLANWKQEFDPARQFRPRKMWLLGTIFQDNLPWLLFVFVPLQIGRRGTDAGNIGSAIFIEIRDGAGRGGHTALV